MRITLFALFCGTLLMADVTCGWLEMKHDDEASRKAYFAQRERVWGDNGYKTKPDAFNALATLATGKVKYVFHLNGEIAGGELRKVSIGMHRPSGLNWYGGGFIDVKRENRRLTNGVFTLKELTGGKDSGRLVAEYKGAELSGTITLELRDDDDKLLVTVQPDGTAPYKVVLVAYPGAYGEKELRHREISLASGNIEGKKAELPAGNYWCVFADSYYDKAQNRGDGCCGFLYNPYELAQGTVERDYPCTATMEYPANTDAHFVLWDFKGWTWAQAVEYMKNLKVTFDKKEEK